jgi:hypothetical protein
MCGTASRLMQTKYVHYSREPNADKLCLVQQKLKFSKKMCVTAESLMLGNTCVTAESLMLIQYVLHKRQFNAVTILLLEQIV